MPPKRKSSFLKNFGLFLLIVCVAQLGYMAYSNVTAAPEQRSAEIDKQVQSISDPRKREQKRIQMAVRIYQLEHQGALPNELAELVPAYLEKVPVDPKTGKVFTYNKVDKDFEVGEEEKVLTKSEIDLAAATTDGKTDSVLVEALANKAESDWLYDPKGKRDPFVPTDLLIAPTPNPGAANHPLCRFALNQLKLTAVLEGFTPTRAIVETADGKGHMVQPGDKMGLACGEIAKIEKDKLIVLEEERDPFDPENPDAIKRTQVELNLRLKEE
jgi:hypothetical protein